MEVSAPGCGLVGALLTLVEEALGCTPCAGSRRPGLDAASGD